MLMIVLKQVVAVTPFKTFPVSFISGCLSIFLLIALSSAAYVRKRKEVNAPLLEKDMFPEAKEGTKRDKTAFLGEKRQLVISCSSRSHGPINCSPYVNPKILAIGPVLTLCDWFESHHHFVQLKTFAQISNPFLLKFPGTQAPNTSIVKTRSHLNALSPKLKQQSSIFQATSPTLNWNNQDLSLRSSRCNKKTVPKNGDCFLVIDRADDDTKIETVTESPCLSTIIAQLEKSERSDWSI